jgi:hypothetical protein
MRRLAHPTVIPTVVVGGNFLKKLARKTMNVYKKGKDFYEKADKATTRAREATHSAVSGIREQIGNAAAIMTPLVGADRVSDYRNTLEKAINPYLDKATDTAKRVEGYQTKVREAADTAARLIPIPDPVPDPVPSSEEGGAFYPTGYAKHGGSFDTAGSGRKRKAVAPLGGAVLKRRGPYGKLNRHNMLRGIHAAIKTIKDALPKVSGESKNALSVELAAPGEESAETTPVEEAVGGSYGGLVSQNLPQFKNQIQAFAALMADRIATDLAETIDTDPRFTRVLTTVIASFMKVFDETGGVLPDDMFALKKTSAVAKAAGGKFTMKGVENFGKKAYNTLKTVANDAAEFVKKNPEVLAALLV